MSPTDLHQQVSQLPSKPGVYLFRDEKGALLYVGKAKSLKDRIKSYFEYNRVGALDSNAPTAEIPSLQPAKNLTPAKQLMVSRIRTIETTIVSNETEALLLEAELIKRHRPPYNIVLADDKSFVYIKFDFDRAYPDVYPVRRPVQKRNSRSLLFGPYTSASAAYTALRLAKKIFPYCLKPPAERHPRHPRGCLNWHLKRCPGPCIGAITPASYERNLRRMVPLFQGKFNELSKQLIAEMHEASGKHDFERAAIVRDQISSLKTVAEKQKVVGTRKESYDVLSLAHDETMSVMNVFRVREGVLLERASFPLRHPAASRSSELIESFLQQYYALASDAPHVVLTPLQTHSPLPGALKTTVPLRGKKRQLMRLGQENAEEELSRYLSLHNLKELRVREALTSLAKLLELPEPPQRIEAYDISNVQGRHAVGAMTVLLHGIPAPREYRTFTIKTVHGSNDVAMLQEVLRRRLAHSAQEIKKTNNQKIKKSPNSITHKLKNSKTESWPLPDLIVIDGGKPQLSAALAVLAEYSFNIPLLSLAKGRGSKVRRGETIFALSRASSGRNEKRLGGFAGMASEGRAKPRAERAIPRRGIEPRLFVRPPRASARVSPRDIFTTIKLPPSSPALLLLDRIRDEAHRFGITRYREKHRKNMMTTRIDDITGIGPKTRTLLLHAYGSWEAARQAPHTDLVKLIGEKKAKIISEIPLH